MIELRSLIEYHSWSHILNGSDTKANLMERAEQIYSVYLFVTYIYYDIDANG